MSILTQGTVLRPSNTFEFRSEFPDLHLPAHPVASPNLLNPNHADALVDGEWVWLDAQGRINKITTDDLPGGAQAKDGTYFRLVRGAPGRTDNQMAQSMPVCKSNDFEFITRLFEAGAWVPGAKAKVGLVAFPKAATAGLVPATAGDAYVAEFERMEGSDGWAFFTCRRGVLPA